MEARLLYKRGLAAIILVAFFLQTFDRSLIVADYYIHTESYAVNCENKAQPQMQCHGKCQMEKKLKEEDKKDQQNPERKSENKNEITLSDKSFFAKVEPQSYYGKPAAYPPYRSGHITTIAQSIFHPPSA